MSFVKPVECAPCDSGDSEGVVSRVVSDIELFALACSNLVKRGGLENGGVGWEEDVDKVVGCLDGA